VSDLEFQIWDEALATDVSLTYHGANRSNREKLFERQSEPSWQHWTDYGRKPIPLSIIEKMRVVEGLDTEAWCKRGVEVGHAAWKVLIDYVEGPEAASHAEGAVIYE
jgi:hypothetical protein